MGREYAPDIMILLIEDDEDIAHLVTYSLQQAHLEVRAEGTGMAGLRAARERPPSLILLDLMLPDLSGLEVCRALKRDAATQSVPVVMLTARQEEVDRIVGFEVGAEDYIAKPFSPRELVLRVQAILRRCQGGASAPASHILSAGPITLDPDHHCAWVDNVEITLTAIEFRLLQYFLQTRTRVATRDQLLDQVWGYDAALTTRTVDTHIKRLRDKLGPAGDIIETLRGVGYRLR